MQQTWDYNNKKPFWNLCTRRLYGAFYVRAEKFILGMSSYILIFCSQGGQRESCKILSSSKGNVMRIMVGSWDKWIADQAHTFNFNF